MYTYRTYFYLEFPVIDFNAAYDYLTEDDMVVYLRGDDRIPERARNAISSVDWILKDEESGYIEVESEIELTQKELDAVSDWISGQNSDGIGEGFDQQSFAEYYADVTTGEAYSIGQAWSLEDDSNLELVVAEFDWKSNPYKLELVHSDD